MSSQVHRAPSVRALALLLAALGWGISGCGNPPTPTVVPSAAVAATPTPTPTPTPSPSPTPSPTATPTPTPTPTPSPKLDGPALAGVESCPGPSAAPKSGPTHNNVSTNWSGYAVTAADPVITCIEAQWVQPKVTCRKARSSLSIWVGLGGFSQTRLVQVGTAIDCINGLPLDYAWHESLPAERSEVDAPISVEPGDRIWAQVRWLSGSGYQLSIADITHPDGFTVRTTNRGLRREEAEWIAEAPTGGCPSNCHILPMPSFGKVQFEKLSLTIGGAETGLLSPRFTRYRITMISQSYVTRAVVTATARDGRAFTVGFKHA